MTATARTADPPGVVHLRPAAEALVYCGERGFERCAFTDVRLHEGDAIVKVELATVCGSDLHTVAGTRSVAVPGILGHEQVGRIVALGPGEPPRTTSGAVLHIGDRVVWAVAIECGECRMCRRGIPNKCLHLRKYGHERMTRGWELNGGMATHVHLLAGTSVVRVPAELPAEVLAPASCATATVAAAIDAATSERPLYGEIVVVSGCGMLGITAVAMAAEAGALVVAVDPDASRRERARAFGAAEVAGIRSGELAGAIARIVARDPRLEGAKGFGIGLELSGSGDAVVALLSHADIGAVIVLAGSVFPAPSVPVSAEAIVRRLLTIRGVHNYRAEHLEQAVAFLRRVDPGPFAALVAETVDGAHAEDALHVRPAAGTRVGVRF